MNMEPQLSSILSRISSKLQNFTAETNQSPYLSSSNPSPITQSYKYQRYQPMHQLDYDCQVNMGRDSYDGKIIGIQSHRDNRKVQIQVNNRIQARRRELLQKRSENNNVNKNKNMKYEEFRASRSHENIQTLQSNFDIENNHQMKSHQQNFMSLKKRNMALENDVKKLQNKLKQLQESLDKDHKVQSSKQKQLKKIKSSGNEQLKRQSKISIHNNLTDKNVKKVPMMKSYYIDPTHSHKKIAQIKKNSGVNSTSTLPTNKHITQTNDKKPSTGAINKSSTIKKSQTRLNQALNFQTSLQNIPLYNYSSNQSQLQNNSHKLIKQPQNPIIFNPETVQNSQNLLTRCKSVQNLSNKLIIQDDCIKQKNEKVYKQHAKLKKIRGSKQRVIDQSSCSVHSHASYLKPVVEKKDVTVKIDKQKFVKRRNNEELVNKRNRNNVNKIN